LRRLRSRIGGACMVLRNRSYRGERVGFTTNQRSVKWLLVRNEYLAAGNRILKTTVGTAQAQYSDGVIRVGVLNDQAGLRELVAISRRVVQLFHNPPAARRCPRSSRSAAHVRRN
jgi:hypothetical protein